MSEPEDPAVEEEEKTRSRMGHGPWLLAGLAALGWMAVGAISWFIIGHACPPGERQWSLGVGRWVAFAVTLVALAITVGAIVRSFGTLAANEPLPEGTQQPTLVETMSEQKRFTGMLALLVGATLTLGLVFTVLSTLVIRVCGETR